MSNQFACPKSSEFYRVAVGELSLASVAKRRFFSKLSIRKLSISRIPVSWNW